MIDQRTLAAAGMNGRSFATPILYTCKVGTSDATPHTMCDALSVAGTSREGVSRLEVPAPMSPLNDTPHADPRWAAYKALLNAERKLELAGLDAAARTVRGIRRRLP